MRGALMLCPGAWSTHVMSYYVYRSIMTANYSRLFMTTFFSFQSDPSVKRTCVVFNHPQAACTAVACSPKSFQFDAFVPSLGGIYRSGVSGGYCGGKGKNVLSERGPFG